MTRIQASSGHIDGQEEEIRSSPTSGTAFAGHQLATQLSCGPLTTEHVRHVPLSLEVFSENAKDIAVYQYFATVRNLGRSAAER